MTKRKKATNVELKDGIKLPNMLSFYDKAEFLLKNKVRLLFILARVFILIELALMIILSIAHIKNPIYIPYLTTLTISILLTLALITILIKGHYALAADIMLINMFASVWVSIFLYKNITIEQIDNVLYVFSLLFFLPLISKTQRSAIFICVINIIIAIIFYSFNAERIISLGGNGYNSLLDCIIAMSIACFLIVVTVKIYNDTLHQKLLYINEIKEANNNLAEYRNNLENIVQERTDELSAINEELCSTNLELSSANVELANKNMELNNALIELEKAQRQLVESEKMNSLGLLASGIAHEINNPLNYIRYGVLGIENYFNDHFHEHMDEVQTLLDAVNEGVDRAARIVSSVSRYSHHSNRTDEICDLHLILDSSIVLLHNQLQSNMTIKKRYCPERLLVLGNEGRLHQLFVNILQNAIHAIGTEGYIEVTTQKFENQAIVEIADNGSGISQEVMEHIFEPFYTTKDPGQGSGIGLSISYSIVMEHNGNISYSSAVGEGTKATIAFPTIVDTFN